MSWLGDPNWDISRGLPHGVLGLDLSGCDVARFSYEVFHDRIDQGIDSIRDTLLNLIDDGWDIYIFILSIFPF